MVQNEVNARTIKGYKVFEPISSAVSVKDESKKFQVNLMTDRPSLASVKHPQSSDLAIDIVHLSTYKHMLSTQYWFQIIKPEVKSSNHRKIQVINQLSPLQYAYSANVSATSCGYGGYYGGSYGGNYGGYSGGNYSGCYSNYGGSYDNYKSDVNTT